MASGKTGPLTVTIFPLATVVLVTAALPAAGFGLSPAPAAITAAERRKARRFIVASLKDRSHTY
jgi:hypothetical protein